MFTMKCKTTGWCAVAFTTGDGKSMKDYDIALGGVASGTGYIGVSGMDFIQYKELSFFNLEHLTDAGRTSVLNNVHKFTLIGLNKCLLLVGLYDNEISIAMMQMSNILCLQQHLYRQLSWPSGSAIGARCIESF